MTRRLRGATHRCRAGELATFSHDRWLISVPDFAHAARREARPGWGRRWGGWTVQPLRPTDPRHQLSGRSPIDFPRARAQRCRKRRVRGGTRCARRPIIDLIVFSASYTLWCNENVKTNRIMDRMRALEFCDWCFRGRWRRQVKVKIGILGPAGGPAGARSVARVPGDDTRPSDARDWANTPSCVASLLHGTDGTHLGPPFAMTRRVPRYAPAAHARSIALPEPPCSLPARMRPRPC